MSDPYVDDDYVVADYVEETALRAAFGAVEIDVEVDAAGDDDAVPFEIVIPALEI